MHRIHSARFRFQIRGLRLNKSPYKERAPMLKLLLAFLVLPAFATADTCQTEFDRRGSGSQRTQEALTCYSELLKTSLSRNDKAHALTQLSYLKFFQAEYFSHQKEKLLLEAMGTAEKAVLLFGSKYSLSEYRQLPLNDQKVLAEALYNYGLIVARYIDEKGVIEALKRMDDIKKSMNTIIRLKQEAVAHYGAFRVLGIFHMKVPSIAGGDINLSKDYLPKAISGSLYSPGLSRYPLNNLVYSDLLFKLGKNQESCDQLKLLAQLSPEEVRSMDNGMLFESLQNVEAAKEQLRARRCAR